MSEQLIYVDTAEVREGAVEEVKRAIAELAAFIDANEPQILAYNVYLSDDGRQMSVMHRHVDTESLEFHMNIAGPAFGRFADLLTLTSIRLYGEPSERALEQMHQKARLLGCSEVRVYRRHAGFTRSAPDSGAAPHLHVGDG